LHARKWTLILEDRKFGNSATCGIFKYISL
jgi:hypothetical protein